MNVKDERETDKVKLANLNEGDAFKTGDGEIYIVTNTNAGKCLHLGKQRVSTLPYKKEVKYIPPDEITLTIG